MSRRRPEPTPDTDPSRPPTERPTATPSGDLPVATEADAASRPANEDDPLLRQGTHSPDAADIADPDHQL